VKFNRPARCSAIIQPGEFTIDVWDNTQCTQTNPRNLLHCDHCNKYYCNIFHWHAHLDEISEEEENA
jgi:hypothetical protein